MFRSSRGCRQRFVPRERSIYGAGLRVCPCLDVGINLCVEISALDLHWLKRGTNSSIW